MRPNDETADLDAHYIEGYAVAAMRAGRSGQFTVPLVSHIEGNLWMGGCRDGVRLPDDFRFVVSLYPWEKYTLGPNTHREEFELYDDEQIPDPRVLAGIAERINVYRHAGRTLVHCQAGLNRSGLVIALALITEGLAPAAAIDLLRTRRTPVVLCNAVFEHWLLERGGE